MRLIFSFSAFVLALLYWLSGWDFVVILYLLAIAIYEFVKAFKSRHFSSPFFIFLLGWTFPLALAHLPYKKYVFTYEPLGQTVKVLGLLVIGLFYLIGATFITSDLLPRTFLHEGAKRIKGIRLSRSLIIIFYMISNVGFSIAIISSNFVIPIFEEDIVQAAKEFLAVRGSATLFHFGDAALLFSAIRLFQVGKAGLSRKELSSILIVILSLLYLGELVLYGKRMGILVALMSLFIILSMFYKVSRKLILAGVFSIILIVLGNGYVRAVYGYNKFWKDADFHAISNIWEYTLLQPLKYTHQTFNRLNRIIEERKNATRGFGKYTFMDVLSFSEEKKAEHLDKFYLNIKRGAMVSFLGPPVMDGGIIFALIWASFLFYIFWFLYTIRYTVIGVLLYARFAADVAFIWTGNFFHRGLFYTIILIIIALFTLEVAARRVKDISFRTSR
jgi:hypothetical protein